MARGARVMHYRAKGYRLVGVYVKPEYYDKLIEAAAREGTTISEIVNRILDAYFRMCPMSYSLSD